MANEQNLIKNEELTPSQRRLNASKAGKASAKARKKRRALKEELEIPEINLDKVPSSFYYGESYDLPSYYSFGKDTGTVECIVEGKEYKCDYNNKVNKIL